MAYLQVSALPTDIANIIRNVADDLLTRKYRYEREAKFTSAPDLLDLPLPELTPENKADLDLLKGLSSGLEAPGFNFDLDTTSGGFD